MTLNVQSAAKSFKLKLELLIPVVIGTATPVYGAGSWRDGFALIAEESYQKLS